MQPIFVQLIPQAIITNLNTVFSPPKTTTMWKSVWTYTNKYIKEVVIQNYHHHRWRFLDYPQLLQKMVLLMTAWQVA